MIPNLSWVPEYRQGLELLGAGFFDEGLKLLDHVSLNRSSRRWTGSSFRRTARATASWSDVDVLIEVEGSGDQKVQQDSS